MMRVRVMLLVGLMLAVIVTAMGVVHTKYRTRLHFAHLQDLRTQRDAIEVEWNRLRLEEAALSTHVLVERKARRELNMFAPRIGDILLIEERTHVKP